MSLPAFDLVFLLNLDNDAADVVSGTAIESCLAQSVCTLLRLDILPRDLQNPFVRKHVMNALAAQHASQSGRSGTARVRPRSAASLGVRARATCSAYSVPANFWAWK